MRLAFVCAALLATSSQVAGAEGAEPGSCKVASFTTGTVGKDDFERLTFHADADIPTSIDYAYGASPRNLSLTFGGATKVNGAPGMIVSFIKKKLELTIVSDGKTLVVTGAKGYLKIFSWVPAGAPEADFGVCSGEDAALHLVDQFIESGTRLAAAARTPKAFSHGAAGIVFATGGAVTMIVLSNRDPCKLETDNVKPSNGLELVFTAQEDHAEIDGVGKYRIRSSGDDYFDASLQSYDEDCNEQPELAAKSGLVTLTEAPIAGDKDYDGTYDLVFPDGEHLRGSFHAPICKAMNQGLMDIDKPHPDPGCR